MTQWLTVHGAGFEVLVGEAGAPIERVPGARHGVWYGAANPVSAATLGARRLAWHTEQAAVRDSRFAQMALDKSRAARGALTTAQMVEMGPVGLFAEAEARRARARWLKTSSFHSITDRDGYQRLGGSLDRSDYADGKQLERDAVQLDRLGTLMIDGFLAAARSDDLSGAEATRRRAVIEACGWDDCACGAAFQPGERHYARCFKCNQIESADGRVRCVICSKPHAMKFAVCFTCQTAKRDDAGAFLRALVTRRDHFACQMCGDEAGQLQVDHILPCAMGGSAEQWNLQTLCTWCNILKGTRYGQLDEQARLVLMEAYLTYLADFLDDADRTLLRDQFTDTLSRPWEDLDPRVLAAWFIGEDHGTCDDIDGMLTVARMFKPTEVTHVER